MNVSPTTTGRMYWDISRLASISLITFLGCIHSAQAQDESQDDEAKTKAKSAVVEEVVVTGVRASMRDALSAKKQASQILDAIASEDIGKLPDNNVAEALQRVTGVQINRNEAGDGSGFQIRGLSENRVELNGMSMASNEDGGRTNSFDATSSALFKGIEVIKSPTADQTEGAIGGTIRLKTFKPLDFKRAFTAAGSYRAFDSSNEESGFNMSSLLAKRWEVGNGELGVLVNFTYEDRAVTNEAFKLGWSPTQGRTNVQCSSPGGNEAQGVFDPSVNTWGESHNCLDLSKGTTLSADNTGLSGADYPLVDPQYGLTQAETGEWIQQSQVADPSFPNLLYNVLHPSGIKYERKPFSQKRAGLDFNIQWAPFDGFETFIQGTYQDADFKRPQNVFQVAAGAGATGSRIDDGWVLQQFSRAATGDEYLRTLVEGSDSEYEYEAYTGNVITGALTQGRLIDAGNVRLSQENDSKDVKQRNIAMGFDWVMEGFRVKAVFNNTRSDSVEDDRGLRIQANDQLGLDFYWDFTDSRFDVPTLGVIGRNTYYDHTSDSCYTQAMASEAEANVVGDVLVRGVEDTTCGLDLTDMSSWQIQSVFGGFKEFGQEESEFKLDFWSDINRFGFTDIKYGIRATKAENYKRTLEYRTLAQPTNGIALNNYHDPVFGGSTGLQAIEIFEPGFIENAVTVLPGIQQDAAASALFPREWLGIVFNDQYNQWVDRVSDHAYLYDNPRKRGGALETSLAGYIRLNFEKDLWGVLPVRGNFGVRNVRYDYDLDVIRVQLNEDNSVLREDVIVTNLDGYEYYLGPELSELGELYGVDGLDGIDNTLNGEPAVFTSVSKRRLEEILPSFNATAALNDEMYLRMAIAKVVSMPKPADMREVPPQISVDALSIGRLDYKTGNAALQPFQAIQFDLSYEWYMNDSSAFTAAYFFKDIERSITEISRFRFATPEDGFDLDNDQLLGLLLRERRPINTDGGKIHGVELSYRATFDFLPGFASGFGSEINYTFTDSSQNSGINELTGEVLPIAKLSRDSYNLILFYEKYGLSARVAYNWRSESYQESPNVVQDRGDLWAYPLEIDGVVIHEPYSVATAKFQDKRGQLDASINYKFNKKMQIFLQATNLTEEPLTSYIGVPGLVSSYVDVGASYRAGFSLSFK